MPRIAGAELAIIAHARREIDTPTAVEQVCAALVERAKGLCHCTVVASAAGTNPLIIGTLATSWVSDVALRAKDQRRLLKRTEIDVADLDERIEWIAVEPVVTRANVQAGSVIACGELADREECLKALPMIALFVSDIASEMLSRRRLSHLMHEFNNVLAGFVTTVEDLVAIARDEDIGLTPDAMDLTAANGAERLRALLHAGRALSAAVTISRQPKTHISDHPASSKQN